MKKWKTVRIRQELVEEVEREVEKKQSLSDFVSEAVRLRIQNLTKERIPEYLERDRLSRAQQLRAKLFYTPNHICVQANPQGTVRLGITEYFQSQLEEIANIQAHEPGVEVSKDEPFGIVETWWFVHDLYSPLNGRIISVNQQVIDNPFILNVNPYLWIVEIQPNPKDSDSWKDELLSPREYTRLATTLDRRL